MLKWVPVKAIPMVVVALVACAPVDSVLAGQCVMKGETLGTKSSGPLALEVFGAKTLCIEAKGDTNLAPFTPTVRIRNTSADPITLRYQLDPARSFRSRAIWPAGRPRQSRDFSDVSGGASALKKTIGPGEELLISSWTRHNDEIRNRIFPRHGKPAETAPRDFVVRFDLAITYDSGAGSIPVAETFAIPLRAVPVTQ